MLRILAGTDQPDSGNVAVRKRLRLSCVEQDSRFVAGASIRTPSLAVALNCGTGSSFLNALVNAFDKLHIVRGENSGYSGSKTAGAAFATFYALLESLGCGREKLNSTSTNLLNLINS